jgi:hypothetical protein
MKQLQNRMDDPVITLLDDLTIELPTNRDQQRAYHCAGPGCNKIHKPRSIGRVLRHAKACLKLSSEQRKMAAAASASTAPGALAKKFQLDSDATTPPPASETNTSPPPATRLHHLCHAPRISLVSEVVKRFIQHLTSPLSSLSALAAFRLQLLTYLSGKIYFGSRHQVTSLPLEPACLKNI